MKSTTKFNPVQHLKEVLEQQALDVSLKELPAVSGKIDAVIKLND